MTTPPEYDAKAFQEFERVGWDRVASDYSRIAAPGTTLFAGPLLDEAGVGDGSRLLDVASGPGDLAAAAAACGATVVGVDISDAMVSEARRRKPSLEFRRAEAESLPFEDGSFDAVASNFGMLHFAEPERAASEAYRVLVPGGKFAFTVWSTPDKAAFFGTILAAVQAHGRLDVPLPPGPSMFNLANHDECIRVLQAAGFTDPSVKEVTSEGTVDSLDGVLDVVYTTVRTRALLEAQTEEARSAIHNAILEGMRRFEHSGGVRIPMVAVLASGRRPH